jgi:glycosyltransferase involved in cell wall biosynthesis
MVRVAFVSPLPPAPTGIATYANAVLQGLERIGFLRDHDLDRIWPVDADAIRRAKAADVRVYQLGNNVDFHGAIYELSIAEPGVLVLHDLGLDGLVRALGPLTESARVEALAAVVPDADPDDPLAIPWCAQAVRRARVVIVHSRYAREGLLRIGCRTPVMVAAHPLVETDEAIVRAKARRGKLRAQVARDADVVGGIAGDHRESKGITETLAAVAGIGPRAHALLVGRVLPHYRVHEVVAACGLGERVSIVPDVTDEDFLAWLCAVDVLVNLRHPHRGETSGTLIRALQAGVPTVVSAVGTYLELPDDVVVRIPAGPPDEGELLAAIGGLVSDAPAREALGVRAAGFAHTALAPEATAIVYRDAVDLALALEADPERRVLVRWAEALQEVGMSPRLVRRGMGVGFATAVRDLSPDRDPGSVRPKVG